MLRLFASLLLQLYAIVLTVTVLVVLVVVLVVLVLVVLVFVVTFVVCSGANYLQGADSLSLVCDLILL